jgi:hypothetical protein
MQRHGVWGRWAKTRSALLDCRQLAHVQHAFGKLDVDTAGNSPSRRLNGNVERFVMLGKVASTLKKLSVMILTAAMLLSSTLAATAQDARIKMQIVKAGLVVGVGGGSGTLFFRGRNYPLSIGGLSVGATIGGSVANLTGTVRNLKRPSDIIGQYSAVGGGGAVIAGVAAVELQNSRGVLIRVSGPQVGLEFSVDLGGLTISMQ